MKLSVYVNLRSIGWIVSDGAQLVAKGVKRVSVEFDHYYEFVAGLPVTKRINRRVKRQMRRNLYRRRSRKEALKKYLSKHFANPLADLNARELYMLRVQALSRKLTNAEIATVMLSLQKRRGYKSLRGVDNEGSDYLSEIARHEDELAKYKSVAHYLLTLPTAKNIIFTRQSYEAEFQAICRGQQFDSLTTRTLWRLIYFQRPLARGKIATCPLFKNRKVCHASHPSYQLFRAWRDVNNIAISDPTYQDLDIPYSARKLWVDKLLKGKNLTKAACCKDLGIKKSTAYTWRSGKQLFGAATMPEELWQDLFAATDDNKLRQLLGKKYPDLDADTFIDIDLQAYGWGDYSHKAVKRLTPYLERGVKLRDALLQEFGVVDLESDMSLRNLIVEQHFYSYISLVEAIKTKYDITETAIEISQLLKVGNKNRKAIAKNQRMKLKADKSLTDYEHHLLKLWEECGKRSPYEPNVEITHEKLFSEYNVDHIVPKSKLFEHGFVNQTICRQSLNRQKGSLTGIEFARKLGIEQEYRNHIDNLKISEQKRHFYLMDTESVPTDYIQAADYITRCFARNASYVIPNRLVNKYLRQWEWDKYPDNDIRQSLMRAAVVANFNQETIAYFNNLVALPDGQSVGRYNLTPEIVVEATDMVPYVPRPKYYRKTPFGFIARGALHDESVFGRRVEQSRNNKGQLVETEYFTIRKPLTGLSAPMIPKIVDPPIRKIVQAHFEGKEHATAIAELKEKPLLFNKTPIRSVAIRYNAASLIKLPRGYVYNSINHRYNLSEAKGVTLYQYITDLNNGVPYNGRVFKKNDVLEVGGELYFIVGATTDGNMLLRSVWELSAVSALRANKKTIQESKMVRINQLGEWHYQK